MPSPASSSFVTTTDGVDIFYKDWGSKDAQPIMFHHGWPLSSDDWDAQMLFFLDKGYRVVAHDRRGHGRSQQVDFGHDMDHYAADAAAVAEHLDLRNAVHIGHSTGGGEVAAYVARFGIAQGRVDRAVLVSAVPPIMVKTDRYPGGLPIDVFDGFRESLAKNRAQFFRDVASILSISSRTSTLVSTSASKCLASARIDRTDRELSSTQLSAVSSSV